MYLANEGSLCFLRPEYMEGYQDLSLETMLFTILSAQGKKKWQCNEYFTGSTRQYYYCDLHVLCNWNAKKLTLLFTLVVAITHCLMQRTTLKQDADFQ